MKLSEHFTLAEMTKSQTATRMGIDNTPGDGEITALSFLCNTVLEGVRKNFGIPFSPTSGYRSPELNKAIGGSPKSQHCLGQAADIEVPGVSNLDLATYISNNLKFDQLILEYYDGTPTSGWVHVSLVGDYQYTFSEENRLQVMTYDGSTYKTGV